MKELFLVTGDASDGIEGQDMSSASVWNISTWEQVAHWHGYCDPSQFAYILRDIGAYYGWAMICVETNYPGNATHAKLVELEYPKIWTDDDGQPWTLWKTAERAADAAEALGITAHRLKALGLVDKIVNEPVGGAHRDTKWMAAQLKRGLNDKEFRWIFTEYRICE